VVGVSIPRFIDRELDGSWEMMYLRETQRRQSDGARGDGDEEK